MNTLSLELMVGKVNIEQVDIVVDKDTHVSSEWAIPDAYDRRVAIAIAHGAGNDMRNPLLSHIHTAMAERGILAAKFNFPFKQQGRRAPDPTPRLMQTWRAVIDRLTSDGRMAPARLILSGKSLGGRMASMVAAAGERADGLVLFGYPLHPPKRHDKLRVAHFMQVRCPMLFIQGSRDALCDLGLLRTQVLDKHRDRATLDVVEGGDHSFKVPGKLKRTEQSIRDAIVDTTVQWIEDTAAHEA